MMTLVLVLMVTFLVAGVFVAGPNDKAEARRRRGLIRKIQLGCRPCGSE